MLHESRSVSSSGSEIEDFDAEDAIPNSEIVIRKIMKKTNKKFRCFLGTLLMKIIFFHNRSYMEVNDMSRFL
jgi:hypothetical protein